jgi:hypothetical protein
LRSVIVRGQCAKFVQVGNSPAWVESHADF